MKAHLLKSVYGLSVPLATFLLVSFFLTFNLLRLPYFVVGDSFAWTRQNIVDIMGPRIVHESYMGDIALLSTFKTGFLFPLSLLLNWLNLPMTLLFPFIFYFLSMFSFYAFSSEFLDKKLFRIVVSIAYVVNPVTPFYYISLMSAFALVFLPLALKFFVRTLRQTSPQPKSSSIFSGNFALCSLFLALSVSAHEQFLPSIGIIALFFMLTFVAECYHKLSFTVNFGKTVAVNTLIFVAMILLINVQGVISLFNVMNATFASYFTGRFNDFLANVRYTYSTSNPVTLIRFGGDSGAGLGQNAWFDSSALTNLFGYAVFVALVASILLLVLHRNKVPHPDRTFFFMNVLMFTGVLFMIMFIRYLPDNIVLAEGLYRRFSLPLQAFETPAKLRVLLLLSALAASLFVFRELEKFAKTIKRKVLAATLLGIFALSFVVYNSSWVVGDMGFTPVKQISESLGWGELYNQGYSDLANILSTNYGNERGVIVPYTHKAELYASPNFRVFQLISTVNDKMTGLTLSSPVSWSKVMGLLSAKYVVLKDDYDPSEWLIFPKTYDNVVRIVSEMKADLGLKPVERVGNSTVYENENALPLTYASKYYVLYDETNTLRYALNMIDFKNLPVFIASEDQINKMNVPTFARASNYEIKALSLPGVFGSHLTLVAANGDAHRLLQLNKTETLDSLDLYSASYKLLPGDRISVQNADVWVPAAKIDELVLNSTSRALGQYTSFNLNFTVSLLQRGEYRFLSPRVTIDSGDSKYFIIFQDNGYVELATLKGDFFTSGAIMSFSGYDLKNAPNSLDVDISKVVDQVEVRVNGNLQLSFPVDGKVSSVFLSSENSTSRFTNIAIATKNVARLFATRELSNQPDFSVKQNCAERSVLEIRNADSDFAVVVQYLNIPSRNIVTPIEAKPIKANLFFNGWIINPQNSDSQVNVLTIEVDNAQWALAFDIFSITFTWSVLLVAIVFLKKTGSFSELLAGLRNSVKRRRLKKTARDN